MNAVDLLTNWVFDMRGRSWARYCSLDMRHSFKGCSGATVGYCERNGEILLFCDFCQSYHSVYQTDLLPSVSPVGFDSHGVYFRTPHRMITKSPGETLQIDWELQNGL